MPSTGIQAQKARDVSERDLFILVASVNKSRGGAANTMEN